MIKLVTFDLWNTLFENKSYKDLRLYYFTQYLTKNQISYSLKAVNNAFNKTFHLSDGNLKDINYRHIYTRERISRLLQALNINITQSHSKKIEIQFEEIMLHDPPFLKIGVKRTLQDLSETYNIGLISNTGITPGHVIRKIFVNYNIDKYFKFTIFSDETGFYKPNPIMFETALNKIKCKPQNAIHIGDLLETDIKGAQESNMLTIWINDSNSPKLKKIQPDYEIHQIYDAVPLIRGIK
ncbi:MAG: HAD family hydrolase [Promethearchaeota archaeon]